MKHNQTNSQAINRGWLADDLNRDRSWVLYVTEEHIESLNKALRTAKLHNKPLLSWEQDDFPLSESTRDLLSRAIAITQGNWGLCLLKGFPVDQWTEDETRMAYWGMGLYMGVGRPQNRSSDFITDVRDAGGEYTAKGGRGYNTNAELDFHIDSSDIVALLCRRTAKSGGGSKVVSSIALHDEMQRVRPDLLSVLYEPVFHSYQGAQDPSQPEYYRCPVFAQGPDYFCARMNRKNIVAAQRDFPEVPRLTQSQEQAIALLEDLMASDKLCYTMELERGDMQLLNSYVTLHSRTSYVDHDDPDQKRHLLRLWLAIPGSQYLPESWEEYFVDGRPGAVRGGMRGTGVTEEFLRYERRQADKLGMHCASWKPKILKQDMAALLQG